MFGEKFYKQLRKLMPWQRSLFALALSQRMAPNVTLFATQSENVDVMIYETGLCSLWQHLKSPTRPIDLRIFLEKIEAKINEIDPESMFGAYCTRIALMTLSYAYHGVVSRMGSEARQSSDLSINCVIEFVQLQKGHVLTQADLYEQLLIEQELEFQVALLATVQYPRTDELIAKTYRLAVNQCVSNLGIESA